MTESEAIKEFQQSIDLPFGSNVSKQAAKLAIQALEEVQQYREIGTVEECREARNKQKPKKSKLKLCGVIDCRDKDCVFCDRYVDRCPYCNEDLSIDWGLPYKYCPFCGQKLDWSDEHETD